MKIGDVAAPHALLRGGSGQNRGATGFLETLGSVQRSHRARRAPPLYEVSTRQKRAREFEERRERLERAARKLSETAPEAEYSRATKREAAGVEQVKTSREVVTEKTITQAATASSQRSKAFDSSTEVVAGNKSKLHLDLGEGKQVKIQVGKNGASLKDLAAMINTDKDNKGRVVADVVSDAEGFRLRVQTTDTGSDTSIRVARHNFKAPEGGVIVDGKSVKAGKGFKLIDLDLAVAGVDESKKTVTTTETVEGTLRKVRTREVESLQRVDDEEFAADVAEFAQAYNELRSFVDEEGLDVGDKAGLLGSDQRIRAVAGVVSELAGGLAERRSEDGLALSDIGIEVGEDGQLSVDSARLQEALAENTDSVVELLNAEESGLGQATLGVVSAQADPAPSNLAGGLVGFLEGLTSRQERLSEQAGVLETVVSSLSAQGAERDALA